MERSFVAIRYSPLPQPCPVIPFMNIFILEEELSFVSVTLFNVKYPTCDGYELKCLAYIYLFSVEPHPFFLQHCPSALQLFPLPALAIPMCPPTAVVSFLSLSFPMSCRVCCSQGWEQGQVISRANRSHLVCRLQLMGTEAVSDELLVPHSWEILENEQGITLIDSYLGSVLPWGEFGCGIPRNGQCFAIFWKFPRRFTGQALETELWDEEPAQMHGNECGAQRVFSPCCCGFQEACLKAGTHK